MFLTRLKIATAGLLAMAAISLGGGWMAIHQLRAAPPNAQLPDLDAVPKEVVPARIRGILQDARKAAEAIENPRWKTWTLQTIAEEQANARDKASAKDTF
jgi:hypothetical protein